MKNKIYIPQAKVDLYKIFDLLNNKMNFTFVRFSDGETEILRNRYSKITNEEVVYKGRRWKSNFPIYDQKEFNPIIHQLVRNDLMHAAVARDNIYFKGIPTSHNKAQLDKNFYLRLNGCLDKQITFSDLFMNNNHKLFVKLMRAFFDKNKVENLTIIANYRSTLNDFLSGAKLIPIPDNFFSSYKEVRDYVISEVSQLNENSIVLSSASSLSNVIGHYIISNKLPITFIDIGTSLHKFISLDNSSREYFNKRNQKKIIW